MAKKRDPVSEYLSNIGRKGGKVSGVPKGFAAADPETRAAIAKKAAAKRWANRKKTKKTAK
jgi:hypothetical protein